MSTKPVKSRPVDTLVRKGFPRQVFYKALMEVFRIALIEKFQKIFAKTLDYNIFS